MDVRPSQLVEQTKKVEDLFGHYLYLSIEISASIFGIGVDACSYDVILVRLLVSQFEELCVSESIQSKLVDNRHAK